MVVKVVDYMLIAGQLYKMGPNEILRRCVFDHERHWVMSEAHVDVAGVHFTRKETMRKILQSILWWPTIHMDTKSFCRCCDVCQRTGKSSRRDEMPLAPQITLQAFDKWVIDFVGPISPLGKGTSACYIITMTDYLTRWVEATPVKYCTVAAAAKFLFENLVTKFGCPKIFQSDRGTHFVNKLIDELITEFQIHHRKTKPYHSQENGMVGAFNKILENTLTKVCNVRRDDSDQKVLDVLRAYHTTWKRLTGHTSFRLVYVK